MTEHAGNANEDEMTQRGTTCFWCNVDPRKEMPNGISPHSTWCPQYRSPPSPKQIKRQLKALEAIAAFDITPDTGFSVAQLTPRS